MVQDPGRFHRFILSTFVLPLWPFILVLFLLPLLTLLLPRNSDAFQKEQENKHDQLNILIIDSYAPYQPWSQTFFSGLQEAIRTTSHTLSYSFEYLDALRTASGISQTELCTYLQKKYRNTPFSGIIANSDFAGDFLANCGHLLAPDAPKVAYITHGPQLPQRDTAIFTIKQELEQAIKKTAQMALTQNPEAHAILIIEGNNPVSHNSSKVLQQLLTEQTSLPLHLLTDFSLQELQGQIRSSSRDTIIFYTPVSSDNSGHSLIPKEVITGLAAVSKSPIYSFWSTFSGTGIVGGCTLDGKVTGYQLVQAILDYQESGSFKNHYTTLHTYLDWKALKRYDISPSALTEEATLINQPTTLWHTYKKTIYIIAAALFLLVLSGAFLLRKLATVNARLTESKNEMERRVEERTSELAQRNQELQDSESRFSALSEAAFEGIVMIKDQNIIEVNGAVCRELGYQREELLNRAAMDFISPEERTNVIDKILSHFNKPYESSCLHKNGSLIPVEIHGKTVLYRGDEVRVTAVRNISERKVAEQALKEINKKLRDMAMLDGLTQIANRRHFDIKLFEEWRRMIRAQQPLALIIFDVDFFKLYNDTYGHQEGDSCLQTIAQMIQPFCKRQGDLLARYGGEEFAIILPDTSSEGAISLAERICEEIYNKKINHQASPICNVVTVSCGVSCMQPTITEEPTTLLHHADQALYQAKESGRNKVIANIP